MIHWLTQSHTELPARVMESGGYLNEEEQTRLRGMKTPWRRNDWLLGRWTAKRLLQTVFWKKDGVTLPLEMITITNHEDGTPDYRLPFSDRLFSISISHSHGRAFAAAIEKPNAPVGADMERIQSRLAGFAEDYFTMAEIALGYGLVGPERAIWETAVWSGKEAALKALHLGLSVDTRAVTCLIEPMDQIPSIWVPFAIRCDNGRLPKPAPPLAGWWRVEDDFVLTIAAGIQQQI